MANGVDECQLASTTVVGHHCTSSGWVADVIQTIEGASGEIDRDVQLRGVTPAAGVVAHAHEEVQGPERHVRE